MRRRAQILDILRTRIAIATGTRRLTPSLPFWTSHPSKAESICCMPRSSDRGRALDVFTVQDRMLLEGLNGFRLDGLGCFCSLPF